MNLEKAIEIKQIHHNCTSQHMTPDERTADNISIEALKAFKKYRHSPNSWFVKELPGETPEPDSP